MTVAELIKELQKMPQGAQATVYEPEEDWFDKVFYLNIADNGNEVQIIGQYAYELERRSS